jgi:hypothetical protein
MFAPSINVDLEKLQEVTDEEAMAKKREAKQRRQGRKSARAEKQSD